MDKLMNFLQKFADCEKKGFCEKKDEVKELYNSLSEVQKTVAKESYEKMLEMPEKDKNLEMKNLVNNAITDTVENKIKENNEKLSSDIKALLEEERKKANKIGFYSMEPNAKEKAFNNMLRFGFKKIAEKSIRSFNGDAIVNLMTTETPESAGLLTGTEFDYEISNLITEHGVCAKEMSNLVLQKESYQKNFLQVDLITSWSDEGTTIPTTRVELGSKKFELGKMACIVAMSNELVVESEINFKSFILGRVGENFARKEDEAFLIGDGTSTYGSYVGLTNVSGVNSHIMTGRTNFSQIRYEDLTRARSITPSGALKNAIYVMHRSVWSVITGLRTDSVTSGDGAGVFLLDGRIKDTATERSLDGYRVVLSEVMPSIDDSTSGQAFVLFGDFKKSAIRGTRGSIMIEESRDAIARTVDGTATINAFTDDLTLVRFIRHVGYMAMLPIESSNNSATPGSSMTKIVTASSVTPSV